MYNILFTTYINIFKYMYNENIKLTDLQYKWCIYTLNYNDYLETRKIQREL